MALDNGIKKRKRNRASTGAERQFLIKEKPYENRVFVGVFVEINLFIINDFKSDVNRVFPSPLAPIVTEGGRFFRGTGDKIIIGGGTVQ